MNAKTNNKALALRELRVIPGVGRSIAEDLWSLGLRQVADLKGRSPDTLYERLGAAKGGPVDRCMLYVFRCAVYFASTAKPKPALLKWWHWKDRA